jgi:hypothetical protein
MSEDSEGGLHDARFPAMRVIGGDEEARSVAQRAYVKSDEEGVAEAASKAASRIRSAVWVFDIAQEAYDAFVGR